MISETYETELNGVAQASVLVGSSWETGGGDVIPVVNPTNERLLAEIPSATASQVDAVLKAAKRASHSWQRTAPTTRANLIRGIAALLRENAEELALLLMSETGKTRDICFFEVEASAQFLETNAEWALRLEGEILPSDNEQETIHVVREPMGVVVAIIPWNFPLAIFARKLGPALVTGNTVVVKPSEVTPLATIRAIQLIERELDLPPGVLGVVTGAGDVGQALVKSLDTDMVTFTGHRDTGKRIMVDAGANLTRVALELGGKAAAIVLADADLDLTVPLLVTARFGCAGEQCNSAERILVESSIYEEFVERYSAAVAALKVGDPELNLDYGPLVSAEQQRKVASAVEQAIADGATVRIGGQAPEGEGFEKGFWYSPTVLVDVTPSMAIAIEETFGPVVPILSVDSLEEAIAIANNSRYGLSGYLYTRSYASAMAAARDLDVGELFINRANGEAMHAHHAGRRESGYGGEDGKHGMLKYTQLKVVYHNW